MNLPGKGSEVNLPRKGVRFIFLSSLGQVLVIRMNFQHRANDVASFARELLPRTFGFCHGVGGSLSSAGGGSRDSYSVAFQGSGPSFSGSSSLSSGRLSHAGVPDSLIFVAFISQSDGEAG